MHMSGSWAGYSCVVGGWRSNLLTPLLRATSPSCITEAIIGRDAIVSAGWAASLPDKRSRS